MFPVFGEENRRKINLGGNSSSATPQIIFDRVQADRNARQEHRVRHDKAVKIQAWWRRIRDSRSTRAKLKETFVTDALSLTGLRFLVLFGKDEEMLSLWAKEGLVAGPDVLLRPALGENRASWLVLMRQVSILLLRSVADSPESANALAYLNILSLLLSIDTMTKVLGPQGRVICETFTTYLMDRGYYDLLSKAIQRISSKESPSLPPLLNLITFPLSLNFPDSLANIFLSILTIPLLPNKLPIAHLPIFISRLQLARLDVLDPHMHTIVQFTTIEAKIHLAATLHMFISPHYKHLRAPALATYLQLIVILLNHIPAQLFYKRGSGTNSKSKTKVAYDSDSDNDVQVSVVSQFTLPPRPLPVIEDKVLKRIESIISQSHLSNLIARAHSEASLFPHLVAYLFALTALWTNSKEEILNVVLATTSGGGLIREVYRDLVRRSPLGQEELSGNLLDPFNAHHWPPVLLLSDLYSQSLLTMADDEFFGTSSMSGGGARAARNPLTIDELISFSKQLLNIAFTLYWREDQQVKRNENISAEVKCTWETARDKVTKCLLGLHARDSRKPFVPVDHWHVTSQIDMQTFVDAAVLEVDQLNQSDSKHPKTLSKSQLASISPRLGILNNIPFAIPFETRVTIFRHFVVNDIMTQDDGSSHRAFRYGAFRRQFHIQVRRGMVAQDGFDKLVDVNLKAGISISFIDQFGQVEAGIDGGGVFKEFFTSLCQEVFDTDRGLWLENKNNELYPNPHAYATEPHSLNWYRFIGRILGKAMYDGILVDVAFAGFFLAKWLGRQSFFNDLASLDPELYNGLIFLKHYEGNPEDLTLNFTVAIEEFGETKTVDLIPNGSNVPVTRENRLLYIYLVSHYRLSKQIKLQSEAFFEGLSEMIDQKWLRMFNQQEVQILIGGVNAPIDLEDLKTNTHYGGLYDDQHPTIVAFWKVVNSFDQEQRRALLRFVTSCSRPPLLGFKELIPNFSIRDSSADEHRLPSSSTCVNLLKLPRYSSESTLREKVLQAINSGAGFDLS